MSTPRFTTPFGDLLLERYPKDAPSLQAWSAADAHLLSYFHQTILPAWQAGQRLLIINDQFGALATALHSLQPTCWSDSYLAHQALLENLQRNQISTAQVNSLPSTAPLTGSYDAALMLLPKSASLLEFQLQALSQHLRVGATLSIGYMIKHFQPSSRALVERYLGVTQGSITVKKSRLLHAIRGESCPMNSADLTTSYPLEGTPFQLHNDANLFARQHLDIGTRVLLELIPSDASLQRIVDLGCGNGALGIMAAYRNPHAELIFIDESYLATRCAEHNLRNTGLPNAYQCWPGHGLTAMAGKADLILLNPPFHQSNTLVSNIANTLFQQAKDHLTVNGQLLVVGNRHLDYHVTLKRWFRRVKQIGGSQKFVVFRCEP